MIKRILIANRGEIAVRIIKTCKKMGIETIAVFSSEEREALHVQMADERYCIGPGEAEQSYLNGKGILTIARKAGAEAIHPGYGFLAENSEFARLCGENDIIFIGPSPDTINKASNKIRMKKIAKSLSVPIALACIPEKGQNWERLALSLGYPVLLKKKDEGGGTGIFLIHNNRELRGFLENHPNCGDSFYVEKYYDRVKHIEVQLAGDGRGHICVLGDRDCSIQISHKKVVEEAPAYRLSGELRERLYGYAQKIASEINYKSAGTAEFLVDSNENVAFMEFNARIQVEHGITELLTGVDIVELQIKIASGWQLKGMASVMPQRGHAIECRINAQSLGEITGFCCKQNDMVRVDHMMSEHLKISPYYDPLLGKIMVWAPDRDTAVKKAARVLQNTRIQGIETNITLLKNIVSQREFVRGVYCTDFMKKLDIKGMSKYAGARSRISELTDEDSFLEYHEHLMAENCIGFPGYIDKLRNAKAVSGETESVIIGRGTVEGSSCIFIVFEPQFMMGTMGLAAGEKIARAFESAAEQMLPVLSVASSGGARVQEGIYSLFQMVKTVDAVRRHSARGLLYISVIGNPTLGGVSASFASLGDIILMEDSAVFGFTGRRVVEETLLSPLPEDFQTSKYVFKNGQVDIVAKTNELKQIISKILKLHEKDNV